MTEELELQQNKMKPVRFLKQLLSAQHMKLEKNKTKGTSFMSCSLIWKKKKKGNSMLVKSRYCEVTNIVMLE